MPEENLLPAERSLLIRQAAQDVKAAQAIIGTAQNAGDSTLLEHRESKPFGRTMPDHKAPTERVRDLRTKFPETYATILRAVVRRAEPDRATRHRLYRLLGCEPEEQP